MIDREESAVAEAHDVEASVGNVGDRVRREIVHETRVDDRAEFTFGQAWLQVGDEDAWWFRAAASPPKNAQAILRKSRREGERGGFGHGWFLIKR